LGAVCDLAEDLWRRAMNKMGSRSRFFENLRSLTAFLIFLTWEDLMAIFAIRSFSVPPGLCSQFRPSLDFSQLAASRRH
jgi:hypothetical protein